MILSCSNIDKTFVDNHVIKNASFHIEDYEKAAEINSNTQLYKQAGNSIVVDVLEKIFKNLLCK